MLDQELKYYKDQLDELLKHYDGQFVLIKENNLGGSFTTEKEAYEAGLAKYGNKPFLIKRVTKQDRVVSIPVLSLGLLRADHQ